MTVLLSVLIAKWPIGVQDVALTDAFTVITAVVLAVAWWIARRERRT